MLTALLSAAAAIVPHDATLLIVSDEGVIVGIGRAEGGQRLTLRLMRDFHGFGRMVVVADGGQVQGWDVVVNAGVVMMAFEDVRIIVERAGFGDVVIEEDDALDLSSTPALRGPLAYRFGEVPSSGPSDDEAAAGEQPPSGGENAGALPHDEVVTDEVVGNDPEPGAPWAAPPVADPPAPPNAPTVPETPAGTPGHAAGPSGGPPAATPGRPDGPPAHGRGRASGDDAPNGAHTPDDDDEHVPRGRGR